MVSTILVAVDGSPPSQRAVEFASVIAKSTKARMVLLYVHHDLNTVDSVRSLAEKGGFLEDVENDLNDLYDVASTGSPDEEPAALVDIIPPQFRERLGAVILQRAQTIAANHGVSDVASETVGGEAAKAILATAARENVDLIALGSRGLGDLTALILGSVSHKVLHDATCPCVIIK